ncbi:MAG: T9SS C-terminal target domain-containing protein [Bacteroidetes bacterium]|nr:MAG: T9SS C-terminal target domain-containing protein [Bacteroidota bacterium]
MKSVSFLITCAIVACVAFLSFIPNGASQTQENYFDAVQGWDSYFKQHSELTEPPSHDYKIYMRWKTFWNNRICSADSTISGTKYVIQNAMTFYLDNLDYYADASGVGADWHQVGPYYNTNQKNGLVSAIWVDTVGDPSFQTIYIGTNSSGVWKTTNGGSDWINLTDRSGLNLLGVSDITGDPNNKNILYVSSGGENFGRSFSYSIGILRTQDAGESWDIIYGLDPSQQTSINCLLLDPYNTNILYAGVGNQVIRFTKTGTEWVPFVIDTMPQDSAWDKKNLRKIRDIEMKPGAPDTLYIATDNKHWQGTRKAIIYRITGANTSSPDLQRIDQLLPADGALHSERFELAVTPQYPNWLFAQASYYPNNIDSILFDTVYKYGPYFAIWRSKDNGVTWEKKFQEFVYTYYNTNLMGCGRVDYFKNELLLNPVDTSVFYVCGNQMTRVLDWKNDKTTAYDFDGIEGCHPDIRDAMLVSATVGNHGAHDKLFVGNDGGVSKTLNGNESWININGDHLVLTDFYSISSVEAAWDNIAGGTIDNGFYVYNGTSWSNSPGIGESTRTQVDFLAPQYVYTHDLMSGIYTWCTSNSGVNFSNYRSTSNQVGHPNKGLDLNPFTQQSLYTGAYDLYKTISVRNTNRDTIKIPVHIDFDYTAIDSSEKIISVAVSHFDTNVIYFAYDGPHWDQEKRKHKLLKTFNEGQTFVDLLNSGYNNELRYALYSLGITDICLSPTDTNKVWVSIGGFDSNPPSPSNVKNRVYYSNNAGNSFTDISKGLPNFPVNCITYWEGGNDRLFAGTDIGVYYHDASMDRWVPFSAGMPKAIVTEIVVLPDSKIIRASTYGRGIYESELTCTFVSDTLMITSDTTWTESFTSDRSILVQSPAVLTISTTVKFPPLAKIMVEPGATLIVDNGILTNACFNMWQGIEVWGNQDLPQSPASNQGLVSIRNNSIIKNARFGVSTGATDSLGNLNWSTVGGIIQADSSTFRDNYKDIQFMPYHFSNTSRFEDVVFETTSGLAGGQSYPSDHVSMCDVNGIMFQGCTFRNRTHYDTVSEIAQRGNGIHSIDASYMVTSWCSGQEAPCTDPVPTTFSGLNYGVLTYNTNPTNMIKIENSMFTNNRRGIYLGNADYATVTANTFQVPVWEDNDTCYGLYLGRCTGYHIEGNHFVAHNNPLNYGFGATIKEIGLIVDNSGGHPNEIYRNYFDTLDIAINAQRVNRQDGAYPDEGGGVGQVEIHNGLVLKCNIYHNNSYDEVVTRENPTGNEGIAYYQGNPDPDTLTDLAGNLFSPYHDTAQIAESDILNDGSTFYYFHHIQQGGFEPPRTKPDFCDTNVVKARQKSFNFDTTGCCPSRIESQGTPVELREQMDSMQQEVDLLLSEYLTLVDGGSTEELNTEVFMSLPPDAVSLHQELLNNSPYLSDTVMQTAISKEDVLANAMIRDILVANPQSTKSTDVLNELNNRFVPMPEPMMAEILAGQSLISDKEVLEGAIASRNLQRQDLYYRLIRSYKADTVSESSYDSLILLLQQEYSLKAKYLLAFEYLKSGDTASVMSTLNAIPNTFNLSNEQEVLHADYQDYFDLLLALKSENKSILELTQDQITALQNLSATGREPVGSYARNILRVNNLVQYYEPILLPELTNPPPSKPIVESNQITPDDYFKVFPNPAKYFVIIEYNLKEDFTAASGLSFKICDVSGKQIDQVFIRKQKDQFSIPVESYSPGVYLCCLSNKAKVIKSIRFTVIK